MKNKFFKMLRENYGWIVAFTTGLSVVISLILKFWKYICSRLYFGYYGISYSFFDNSELNFLYNVGLSIVLLFCMCSIFFCYIQIFNRKNKNIKRTTLLFDVFWISFFNTLVILFINIHISFLSFVVYWSVLLGVEYFFSRIIFKYESEDVLASDPIRDFVNYLKAFPFYLIVLLFFLSFSYFCEVSNNDSYYIIDNNKVIVYSTADYSIVLDCEISNNELIIYRGYQTKISNSNVKSILLSFDKVSLLNG